MISGASNANDMDSHDSQNDQTSEHSSDTQYIPSEHSSARSIRRSNAPRTDVEPTDQFSEHDSDQHRSDVEQDEQLSDVQSNTSLLRSNLVSEIGNGFEFTHYFPNYLIIYNWFHNFIIPA